MCILSRFSVDRTVGFSTEQEVKLFYPAMATRGHRFGGVLITLRGRDLFLLALMFG